MHAHSNNPGHFRKGYDARRHTFTREECQAGFWAAIESIMARYPAAITSYHAHMVVNFLPAVVARKREKGSRRASC